MEIQNRVTTFPSEAQWCALCDMVLQDKELLTGEFQGPNGKVRVEGKWKRIAEQLNEMNPGARKTVAQWKEALNGLKSRAKKAYREKLEHMSGTGGGPPREHSAEELGLSAAHAKACSIVGLLSIVGDQNVPHPLQLQMRNASNRQGLPSHYGGSSSANTASLHSEATAYSRYASTSDPPRRNWDASQAASVSNQRGYGSPNQRGYGSPNQRGYGYGSPYQRGYGSPSQRQYRSPSQRLYGSPNQRGFRSPNQRGYGSPYSRDHNRPAHQTDQRTQYSPYRRSPSYRSSQGKRDHGCSSSLDLNLTGQRMYAHGMNNAPRVERSPLQSLQTEIPLSPPKKNDQSTGSARKKLVYSVEVDNSKDDAVHSVEGDNSKDDAVHSVEGDNSKDDAVHSVDVDNKKGDDVGVAELPIVRDWRCELLEAVKSLKSSVDKNTAAVQANGESLRILTCL